ncbi:MAG: nucleoside monophosphate kinase [Candidatus Thiodiazotropha sp.]
MRIVILGAPGSGKRTQTDLLADKYGLSSVMTGELVKNAVQERTPLGLEIKELQDAGRVVTEDLVLALLRERLLKSELQDGFVLDGFPRNLLQALTLDELMIEIDQPLDLILLIDIETDTLMERLVGRRTCRSCGLLYNIYRNPPVVDDVCDVCGGRLHQRSDDNEETVSSRIHVFDHLISPLITHYEKQGKLIRIDGNGEVGQVFQLICKTIDEGSRAPDREVSIEAQPVIEERAEERDDSAALEEASARSIEEAEASASAASREKNPAPGKIVKKKVARKKAESKRAAKKRVSKKRSAAKQGEKKKASKKKAGRPPAAKSRTVKKKSTAHRAVQKKSAKKKLSKKKAPKAKVTQKKKVTTKKAVSKPSSRKKAKSTTGSTKKGSKASAKSKRSAVRQRGKVAKKRTKGKAIKRAPARGAAKKRTAESAGLNKMAAKGSPGKKAAAKKTKSKRSNSRKK